MWAKRFLAFAVAAVLTVACGGKSIYTEGGGEAGGGSQCEATQCGDECVDIENDRNHCGECFDRCNSDERCVRGSCIGAQGCEPPTTLCNGACVDLRYSQDNCGACGNACGFGSFCNGGSCTAQCPGGQCGTICVNFDTDRNNCGGCGISCGFGAQCSGGRCIAVCEGGALCNGACVDIWNDPYNCGGCNAQCLGGNLACIEGQCLPVCPPDALYCDGRCVDWRFDSEHCGGCGLSCSSASECINGACVPICPSGTYCDGVCADLSSDPNHCGGCHSRCLTGTSCFNGECIGPGMCGDQVVQRSEEADPPPGPSAIVPVDARTCRYDFSRINQWYCNGSCGNWGGPDGCDQLDANAFCALKMDNPRSTATAWTTTQAQPAPGVCCPPPTDAPGSRGCTPLGVLSTRGVNISVSVHPSNLFSTHQAGTVITNLVCTDP
jgi:hypothetical protein